MEIVSFLMRLQASPLALTEEEYALLLGSALVFRYCARDLAALVDTTVRVCQARLEQGDFQPSPLLSPEDASRCCRLVAEGCILNCSFRDQGRPPESWVRPEVLSGVFNAAMQYHRAARLQ